MIPGRMQAQGPAEARGKATAPTPPPDIPLIAGVCGPVKNRKLVGAAQTRAHGCADDLGFADFAEVTAGAAEPVPLGAGRTTSSTGGGASWRGGSSLGIG